MFNYPKTSLSFYNLPRVSFLLHKIQAHAVPFWMYEGNCVTYTFSLNQFPDFRMQSLGMDLYMNGEIY